MSAAIMSGRVMKGPHQKWERQILKNSSDNIKKTCDSEGMEYVKSLPGCDRNMSNASHSFYADGQWIEVFGSYGYVRVNLVYSERDKESITIIRDLGSTCIEGKRDVKEYILSNYRVEIEESVPGLRLPARL